MNGYVLDAHSCQVRMFVLDLLVLVLVLVGEVVRVLGGLVASVRQRWSVSVSVGDVLILLLGFWVWLLVVVVVGAVPVAFARLVRRLLLLGPR